MLIVPLPSPDIFRGRSTAQPLLLRGPRLPDGRIADVTIAGGVAVISARLPAALGTAADLVASRLTPAEAMAAVTSRGADRIVMRGGRVVARNVAVSGLARPKREAVMSAWNL
ncbi:MAG TPA: hypothetical protein VGU21_04725 [Streptosporangiaceae bacterium]|nr:hypothetical protein [Streptosporangiaceae bacterium]